LSVLVFWYVMPLTRVCVAAVLRLPPDSTTVAVPPLTVAV